MHLKGKYIMTKWDFQRMQGWLNIRKLVNEIKEQRKTMITSVVALKKNFDKNQHPFKIKMLRKLEIEWTSSNC